MTPNRSARSRGFSPLRLLAIEAPLTAVLCVLLWTVTRSEITWVLAGILGGWLGSLAVRLFRARPNPNPKVRKTGQFMIGVAIGPTLAAQSLSGVLPHLHLILILVTLTLGGAVVIGLSYSRIARVDRLTAGLATLPGGIGVMSAIAADRGRPPQFVALVQGLRVTAIVSVAPVLIHFLGTDRGSAEISLQLLISGNAWVFYVISIVGAGGAAWVAARLRVPVASLLGPMFFGLAFAIALSALTSGDVLLQIPYLHEIVGQALLGITVGEYLARRVRMNKGTVIGGVVSVAAGLLFAGGLATVLSSMTGWSLLTCFLMAAPGGAPEMIVLAAASGAELHLVVFAQIVRQIGVNALVPLWLKIFDQPDPEREHRSDPEPDPVTSS